MMNIAKLGIVSRSLKIIARSQTRVNAGLAACCDIHYANIRARQGGTVRGTDADVTSL